MTLRACPILLPKKFARMNALLVRILKEAVPSCPVSDAYSVRCNLFAAPRNYSIGYYIHVRPFHYDFWREFQRNYPNWRECALELGGNASFVCPVFKTKRQLALWLCRTLSMPVTVADLLALSCRWV